ncbi:FixH family protein [Hydrogenophaga sp.]|uniref:FixH family protein n=1 Tax=Hydrogenophaga sp. TaxID=1904254 RepID=UPI00262E64D6|nr:FixH family protein [Hydrogenophaga sp.]MCW5655940.1 FixH family protein [Hydrogenophaga sp.]
MNTRTSVPSVSPAWWRVPQMWLVVGGPLAVVVASLVTAWIAVHNADPVLDKTEFERGRQAAMALQGQARTDALVKLQPAHQARNHAASPVVPEGQ